MGKSPSRRRKTGIIKTRKSYKIKGTKRLSNTRRKNLQKNIRKKQRRSRRRVTISNTANEFSFLKGSLPVDVRNSMNVTRRTKQ